MNAVTTVGLDADDTLWQNEQFFRITEERFCALLAAHCDAPDLGSRLFAAETRNLARYGFGIKGFTLSMIETALDVTDDAVPGRTIRQIVEFGRSMLEHPVETLPHARAALEDLAGSYRLVLVTKGDLFDQERKLAASGLGDLFDAVEIVSDKTAAAYRRIFSRHGDGPERAVMVGNSLKSDVLPALEAGSFAVHVPHELTWAFEHADAPETHPRFRRIADLGELGALVRGLAA